MHIYNEEKPYIFISYAHRNSEKVVPILKQLQQDGYNFWYDEGIEPGSEWDEFIANKISNCGYFIAFVSNAYIQSKNCKDELNYARDLDKELLLIYLEEVILPAGMAMRLNRIQAMNWYLYKGNTLADAYQKLYAASGISNTKLLPKQNVAAESVPEPAKSQPAQTATVPLQELPPVTPHPTAVSQPVNNITTRQAPQVPKTVTVAQPVVKQTANTVVQKPVNKEQSSSTATAFSVIALIIGIFGIMTSYCFGGFIGIVGLILGIIAIANRNNKHRTMAVLGTVLSTFAFLLSTVFFIIAMITYP